jgi:hypothetical protein
MDGSRAGNRYRSAMYKLNVDSLQAAAQGTFGSVGQLVSLV